MASRKEAAAERTRSAQAAARHPKAGDGMDASLRGSVKPKTVKVARSAGTGRMVSKAEAASHPESTVVEKVTRKTKPKKAESEPRFFLVLSTSPDYTGEEPNAPMTKPELLALLAEEIMDEGLDERQGSSVPFKIPATMGATVDLLYTTRQDRLKLDAMSRAMKVHETALKDYLINNLPKSDSTGTAGKKAVAQIRTEDQPVLSDYEALTKHIKKTGQFELLNRAINRKSIKERWDAGKDVPGIGHFEVIKVSVTKVGG